MGFKTKQDIRDHIYSGIETDYVVDTNLPPKEVMPRLRKNYYNKDVKTLLVLRNGYTKLFVYYIENPNKKYIIYNIFFMILIQFIGILFIFSF